MTVTSGEVEAFLEEPAAYFDRSLTKMQSIPPDELAALQLEGIRARIREQGERIPLVRWALSQSPEGTGEIEEIDGIAAFLFPHTIYKSYAHDAIERGEFERLTRWADKLTMLDLEPCASVSSSSIDEWLDLLAERAGVEVAFSGGTTGILSFAPWSREDLVRRFEGLRIQQLQTFGEPPSATALDAPFHCISATNRFRQDPMGDCFARGQADYVHVKEGAGQSGDLLWLAAQLRQVEGDDEVALRRRYPALAESLDRFQAAAPARAQAWTEEIEQLQGERVYWLSHPFDIYSLAQPRVERGELWKFDPESAITVAGGAKGAILPDGWKETSQSLVDVPLGEAYGMAEVSAFAMACEHRRYHLPPWVVAIVQDIDGRPLPRSGTQRGRIGLFDLQPHDHWGGVLTGDEVEIEFSAECACGMSSVHLDMEIERVGGGRDDSRLSIGALPYEDLRTFLSAV
jgi:hypothetical protein